MGSIVGYVPYFGLLTDEGRKASWIIKINTTKKPEAQLLGSAIGMKVMEDVPYVIGLDKWLGTELNDTTCAYLKDFWSSHRFQWRSRTVSHCKLDAGGCRTR